QYLNQRKRMAFSPPIQEYSRLRCRSPPQPRLAANSEAKDYGTESGGCLGRSEFGTRYMEIRPRSVSCRKDGRRKRPWDLESGIIMAETDRGRRNVKRGDQVTDFGLG